MSLNKNNVYCVTPRSSKLSDTCKWGGRKWRSNLQLSPSFLYSSLVIKLLLLERVGICNALSLVAIWGRSMDFCGIYWPSTGDGWCSGPVQWPAHPIFIVHKTPYKISESDKAELVKVRRHNKLYHSAAIRRVQITRESKTPKWG